jgi:uncharacterized damage-inducible protein DinB
MSRSLFTRMAHYNAWANRRLYDACGKLSDDAYRGQRPSFFGSIHRTLNHVLVADRIWLGRITGQSLPPMALDTELYADLPSLRAAREAEDRRIIELVEGYGEDGLTECIRYTNTRGEPFEDDLASILQHFFNHQTHHRGQVHDMLSATSVPPPPLDLIYYMREMAKPA